MALSRFLNSTRGPRRAQSQGSQGRGDHCAAPNALPASLANCHPAPRQGHGCIMVLGRSAFGACFTTITGPLQAGPMLVPLACLGNFCFPWRQWCLLCGSAYQHEPSPDPQMAGKPSAMMSLQIHQLVPKVHSRPLHLCPLPGSAQCHVRLFWLALTLVSYFSCGLLPGSLEVVQRI